MSWKSRVLGPSFRIMTTKEEKISCTFLTGYDALFILIIFILSREAMPTLTLSLPCQFNSWNDSNYSYMLICTFFSFFFLQQMHEFVI
jgi:hypothetical protein